MGLARVLLVEDEGILRLVMEEFLLENGFDVVEAWNGDAAAKLLEEAERFDVLLTDVRMPGLIDGVALANIARRHDPSIPVLVVSGYAEDLVNRLAALDPPVALMSKPYDLKAVADTLRRLTAKP